MGRMYLTMMIVGFFAGLLTGAVFIDTSEIELRLILLDWVIKPSYFLLACYFIDVVICSLIKLAFNYKLPEFKNLTYRCPRPEPAIRVFHFVHNAFGVLFSFLIGYLATVFFVLNIKHFFLSIGG